MCSYWGSLLPPLFFCSLLYVLMIPRVPPKLGSSALPDIPALPTRQPISVSPRTTSSSLSLDASSNFHVKTSQHARAGQPPSPALKHPPPPQSCDVLCWLAAWKIPIPTLSAEYFGFVITVSDGFCSGATFSDMESTIVPPRGSEIEVSGMSLTCDLKWRLSWLHSSTEGSVIAAVNHSSLKFGFSIETDSDDLVAAVSPTICSPEIRISELHFSGDFEKLLNLITKLLESTITKSVSKNICLGIHAGFSFLSGTLRNVSNSIRPFTRPLPPAAEPPVPNGCVDFTENQYVKLLDYLLDDVVGVQGPLGINKIIDALSHGTGSFDFSSLPFPSASLSDSVFNVSLGATDLLIARLNSWQTLRLLRPTSNFTLSIQSALQHLNFSLGFVVAVDSPDSGSSTLLETGVLSLTLSNMSLASSVAVGIDASYCASISSQKLLQPDCLLPAIRVLNVTSLLVDFELVDFNLSSRNSSDASARGIDAAMTTLVRLVSSSCRSGLSAYANGVIGTVLREKVNAVLFEVIHTSTSTSDVAGDKSDACTVTDWAVLNPIDVPDSIVAVSSALALIFLTIVFFVCRAWRKHKFMSLRATIARSLSLPLLQESAEAVGAASGDPVSLVMGAECDDDESSCLLLNSRVSFSMRAVPFCLLFFNIALFVSANMSIGCSVKPVIRSYDRQGTESVRVLPSLFDFTLQNTVKDMWTSGDYSLSILVAVFSGIWPYLKIVIMLLCMVTPPSHMSPSRRERILMFIDAFGKWSNLDSFVMTMMMCAFHISLSPSSDSVIPFDGHVLIDVFVDQEYGFSVFLIASCMSLVLCHVVLHIHRVSSLPHCQTSDHRALKRSLCSMSAPILSVSLGILLPLVFCLVGAGISFDSFEFTFSGAVGVVYKFIGKNPSESYSILSVGLGLPSRTYHPTTPDIPMLQAAWVTFAVALPLLHLLLLFILFFVPFRYQVQRRLFHAVEVVGAWASLEVAIVSIMAALVQLSLFTSFMVGDKCNVVNKLLAQYGRDLVGDDTVCFQVSAHLLPWCYLLFSCCAVALSKIEAQESFRL